MVTGEGRRVGAIGWLKVIVERTGGTITVDAAYDNVANQSVATAPVDFQGPVNFSFPMHSGATSRPATGSYIPFTGVITLAGVGGTANIVNGDQVELGGVFFMV
jgi:hypothetical protein